MAWGEYEAQLDPKDVILASGDGVKVDITLDTLGELLKDARTVGGGECDALVDSDGGAEALVESLLLPLELSLLHTTRDQSRMKNRKFIVKITPQGLLASYKVHWWGGEKGFLLALFHK